MVVLGGGGAGRWWDDGDRALTWDQCPSRDPGLFVLCVLQWEEGCHELESGLSSLSAPRSWTSQPPELWEINVCCLSPNPLYFCYGLRHMLITLWCKRVCVCDGIRYVCVWERERWNQVCLCVCNTESSMCEYVRERERIKCAQSVLQRMEPLLAWPWLRMSRGWACWVSPRKRWSSSPGGTRLLHKAYVHRKSKELSWIRNEAEWLPWRIYFSLKACLILSPGASVCANQAWEIRSCILSDCALFSSHSQKTSWT